MSGFEALLTGRVLADRYRIEQVIGRGGMGAVYRATDERLGRPVAVKVVTAALGGDAGLRERVRARFRHEAASAARLPHHPNVVPVYDYGTDEALGLDYIVMELLRGEDVATRLQTSGPPPMGVALRILQHAARGVSVGHRAGLIHRDVKPGNVFLVEDQDELQVRVLDFGIAKAVAEEETQSALTQDGRAPLSPAYASPEQLRGEPRLTPASDVFSLGAVGFQLLTGERAFTEADRNRMALGQEVPVPSLRSRNPHVPDDVEAILRRALSADPAERFPHAGALADALEGPLVRLGGTPAETHIPLPAAAPGAGPDEDHTEFAGDHTVMAPRQGPPRPPAGPAIPAPRRRREPERSGVGGVVLGVVLLLALGAGGFFVWQETNADAEEVEPVVVADSVAVEDTVPVDTLGPDDALAASLEGLRFFRAGDYRMAASLFEKAIAIEPRNAEYRDQYAVALMQQGRFEEAAEVLEQAIRLNRNYELAYSHLAEARLAQGDTASALVALRRFRELSLNPEDRARAQELIDELTAPQPVLTPPPPLDTEPWQPGPGLRDSLRIRPEAPRDTIQLAPPLRER